MIQFIELTQFIVVNPIPAVPFCRWNIEYLRKQRDAFKHDYLPPDFLSGQGKFKHIGRGTLDTLRDLGETKAMDFEPFEVDSNYFVRQKYIRTYIFHLIVFQLEYQTNI